MNTQYDLAVVGAGILGLAHAYHAARQGAKVVVLDRHPRAQGASVRNFGMLWPIGQPIGPMRDLAMASLGHWRELIPAAGLWHEPCGALHLAYEDDEAQVLREFAQIAESRGVAVQLLDADQAARDFPHVQRPGLKLALRTLDEICIDPREAVARLPEFLASRFGVEFRFGEPVIGWDRPRVISTRGELHANRMIVCAGDEARLLFPAEHLALGLVPCKLQMLRSRPIQPSARLNTMLAAGLTLRHYKSFADCPTLPALRERVARTRPELDHFGIHVLVSQNQAGELAIGDSHEYGDAITPFDRDEIDTLILDYLATFLNVPGLEIATRWHGIYAKHPTEPFCILEPADGATIVTGVGGNGMTLSFGLAARVVEQVLTGSLS